ncbi:MAG: helix-turn-helix domain-containing protein [Corynebacteriales bacterium]|nr:helix-turn-helix domain-containing protein [Mycobacteriales bacterium]
MTARHSALIRRKRLGAELRRIRKERGLTGAELAKQLGWSESKVSRVETARIGLSMPDARRFVESLALIEEVRDNFLALAEDAANTRGWWNAYRSVITTEQRMVADVEAGAASIRYYASVMLPGLVQTPEYARHCLKWHADLGVGADDVDSAVDIRMARQRVLSGTEPLRYDVLIDESLLLRALAPVDIIRGQLRRLIELATLPHIQLRILPLERENAIWPPAGHSFCLIDFRDPSDPPVVGLESLIDLRYLSEKQHVDTYKALFDRTWSVALARDISIRRLEELAGAA